MTAGYHATDRAVLRLTGADTREFLQNLVTNDVGGLDRGVVYAALLSPAGRPVQTTADMPGFWASSYADVRRDLRGRYPRHPWPEDPAAAAPTRRAKPRGT
jgi:HrpA-like RNA helicase